jgi:multisubunit Na+/H+ antiporter MnhE subunit
MRAGIGHTCAIIGRILGHMHARIYRPYMRAGMGYTYAHTFIYELLYGIIISNLTVVELSTQQADQNPKIFFDF